MDSAVTIESKKKRGRKIWTEEEDKSLIGTIRGKEKISWNEIAEELSKEHNTKKTGKQCRERFRNYADPSLEKCEWKSQEKLLFIILHKIYSHQWCNISKYLTQRSDIAIKNYFYSTVRKALKFYKSGSVPLSLLKKPAKVYQIYNTLDVIRREYLVEGSENTVSLLHKEKIILKLLAERKATEEAVKLYQELIISKVTNFYHSAQLPIKIAVDLKEIGVRGPKIKELISYEKIYNSVPLNQVLVIDAVVTASPMATAMRPNFSPNSLPLQQFTPLPANNYPNSFTYPYPHTFSPYYCIPRTYLPAPQCTYIQMPSTNPMFSTPYLQPQPMSPLSISSLMEPERKAKTDSMNSQHT